MDIIEFEGEAVSRRQYSEDLTPWKDARQKPDRWFTDNWRQFVIAPDEILARAVPVADLGEESGDAGIYFLIDPDGLIAYVGMSSCLGTRIASHQRRRMPMKRVALLTGIPEMFIKYMEAFYINALRPPINDGLPTPCHFMQDDIAAARDGELWGGWKPVEWCLWRDPATRTATLRALASGAAYQHWNPPAR